MLLFFLIFALFVGQDHPEALIQVHPAVFSMMISVLKAVPVCTDRSIHFVRASIVIMINRTERLIHFSGAPIWGFPSARGEWAFCCFGLYFSWRNQMNTIAKAYGIVPYNFRKLLKQLFFRNKLYFISKRSAVGESLCHSLRHYKVYATCTFKLMKMIAVTREMNLTAITYYGVYITYGLFSVKLFAVTCALLFVRWSAHQIRFNNIGISWMDITNN